MTTLVERVSTAQTPESLGMALRDQPGRVILRSAGNTPSPARLSLVAAHPFLTLRVRGSQCALHRGPAPVEVRYGNPWHLLEALLARYELLDELDLPFPLGGAFGYWGYDLRRFLEPRLRAGPPDDLELPDAWIGFYDSLVVFDDRSEGAWIVSTGLRPDGCRDPVRAKAAAETWRRRLESPPVATCDSSTFPPDTRWASRSGRHPGSVSGWTANLDRDAFCAAVARAQRYIRSGDIYQVNLAQRFAAEAPDGGWGLFEDLLAVSPAPFAAFLDGGDFEIASASPELFLRLSGAQILTRPIKGTRPRSADPTVDAQLTYELQTSPKELAELVMITDLLRNDLGRVCEYGSVHVPDLLRLEKYPQVQHLVSTVEGRLRPEITHLSALAACFPGGSITGAPKVRAMQVIDELEPVARGPYTGCLGYLGFNRESQLSILIRSAAVRGNQAWYHAGAGIVADSDPGAEYEETLAKARQFELALELASRRRQAGAVSQRP